MDVIVVERLVQIYQPQIGIFRSKKKEFVALQGIDFTVKKGEVFGLLGPNGAGKTTTIKILTTLLIPTSGSAMVLGNDIVREPEKIRRHIGFVFGGERGLYGRLSGYENLVYFANLYHVPPDIQRKRIPHLLEMVGLAGREREKVQGYSRGMKQRLHIARALLHNPEILFLDEPSIGLDPVGAKEMRQMVVDLQNAGKSILLTTHYMFEADALCQRIAIINHGKIVTLDTPSGIKRHAQDLSIVEIEIAPVSVPVIEKIQTIKGVQTVSVKEQDQKQILHIQFGHETNIKTLLNALEEIGVQIGNLYTREATLEDAYIRLVSV
jgi:ABC-2 type transport system ATP-binding protein